MSQHSIDGRRLFKLGGCWIDDGYGKDHRCAPDEVIRPLSEIAAPRSPKVCPRLQLADAWPDLATKASEPSRDASYRPSYLSWQGVGKSAAGSEQLATWFTGWVCHADVMQALAVFSALREKACGKGRIEPYLVPYPSIRRSRRAIGRYQGPRGAAAAAAGLLRRHGRLRRKSPGRERLWR